MKENATLTELRRLHREWTDRDLFRTIPIPGDRRPVSIRHLIHDMARGNSELRETGQSELATFPDVTDLNKTFGDFVGQSVRTNTGDLISIRGIIFDAFCESVVSELASHISVTCADEQVKTDLFQEFGVKDWRAWLSAVNNEDVTHQIAIALLDDLLARLKDRTLYSFFVREADDSGFINWESSTKSGRGRPLETHRIDDMGRTVVVSVSQYDEQDGGEPIKAYEWNAEIIGGAGGPPDAVACGMVYVFKRKEGLPLGDRSDFIRVADSVADTDVLQVSAFLAQHPDAQAVIDHSDLCFLWLWERRAGAERGLGARCLRAAVKDLQQRFKRVRTVIIDTRPAQFSGWNMPKDPPMVEVAKQTAIEHLVSYVQHVDLANVDVRHIFNRDEDDALAAMAVLGADAMDQLADAARYDSGIKDEPCQFDWSDHTEELATLFGRAGLDELACGVEEGYATCDDIAHALKHLIFHQRIPYLPASISGSIDLVELYGTEGEPLEEALQDVDVEDFENALPPGVILQEAHWQENGDDGGPGWICLVTADTKFCEVGEYFTLIPVPRPMDVSHLIDIDGDGRR
jgi:hypothetical protein